MSPFLTFFRLEFLQVRAVDLVRGAEIHRDAVLHDPVLLHDLVEHLQRTAPVDHEIFRDDFKPVDRGFLPQDVPVVRHAQADADPVVGQTVEGVGGHGGDVGKKNAADKSVGRALAK